MQDLKFKVCIFLLFFVGYLLFFSGHPWIEADYQLTTAKIFVQDHTLSIDKTDLPKNFKNPNGHYYDTHGITNIIVMCPITFFEPVFKKIFGKNADMFMSFLGAFTGIIITSLANLVFFSILYLFIRQLKICFYTTFCMAFLTIVFQYATKNYEGNLNMLFILSSLYFLFNFQEQNKIFNLILSGSFAGLSMNTRDFSLLFVFCITIFILWFSWKKYGRKMAIAFLVGFFPFFILWLYYNWLRTGIFCIPFTVVELLNDARHADRNPFNGNFISGLKGLLFSKGGSIFVYSPVLIFSLFGWKDFFRTRRKECILVLGVIVLYLFANAQIPMWFGLACWGPRYMLEMIPLMLLSLGFWLKTDWLKRKINRYVFVAICTYSLLVQLAGNLTNWHGRLGYLLERKGISAFLFTAKYSQWWDGLKTLFINLWNLLFGRLLYLENPGYDLRMSSASLYTSKTLFTWWNRLIFMGINPIWTLIYLLISLAAITYCLFYIVDYIKKEELKMN